jgi:hypothetical protein
MSTCYWSFNPSSFWAETIKYDFFASENEMSTMQCQICNIQQHNHNLANRIVKSFHINILECNFNNRSLQFEELCFKHSNGKRNSQFWLEWDYEEVLPETSQWTQFNNLSDFNTLFFFYHLWSLSVIMWCLQSFHRLLCHK